MGDHYCVVCHHHNPTTMSCLTCQQRGIAALTLVLLGSLLTSHKVSQTSDLRNQATISWAGYIRPAATGTWSLLQLMQMPSWAITCQKWWAQRRLLHNKATLPNQWHLHRFLKLFRNNAPAGTAANVNSFWREGVESLPRPTLPNPNYKDDRSPSPLAGTTTAGRPKTSVAPSPKWYHALPERSMRHAKLKVGQLFGVLTLLPIINILGHLASHASGEIMPLYDSTHPLQAVSITVSRLTGDIPLEWLELLGEYMKKFAVLGLIAVELGKTEQNLHLQAVMVLHMTGADRCIELITEHLKVWFDIWTHEKFHVKVVRMMRSRGHALFYMLGHCMKDRGLGRFKYIVLNLTREMPRAGISAHDGVSAAASSINNATTSLSRSNWFNKVMKFICTKLKGLNPPACPMRAVTWMLREGDYTIHTDWVETKFGSWVDVSYLANAAILLERPIEATRASVIHLILGRPAGIVYYMDNANRDYTEDRLTMTTDNSGEYIYYAGYGRAASGLGP